MTPPEKTKGTKSYSSKSQDDFNTWIQSADGLPEEAVDWAEEFGKYLANDEKERFGLKKLSTTQLRRFFGQVKRIQVDMKKNQSGYRTKLNMLRPQLAYAKGRDLKSNRSQSKIKDFENQMSKALNAVDKNNPNHFKNFVYLMEAIVAYHKSQGGE